ncbi:unnamed protein product [Anisakis simplex]|uniref:SAYSvFN domain-containing protein n=1 Tax=Anisakis simplex TaxID=6269 RepID=A0A3P6NI61_ANISI|nr:unnamed protein product [Anisakis simplex]
MVAFESVLCGLYRVWEGALDVYPLRAWRAYAARAPWQCAVVTLSTWLILQISAAYVQFGVVFFMFSLFIAMVLNLGERKANEPSAYSVFNPHCERLPGQLTAEHFERDILMRNRRIS